jgi:hypothetical protein
MCQEMIDWSYENYLRMHRIQLGFTPEFVRKQPDRLKAFPHSTRQSLPRVILPAHVLARQTPATGGRSKILGSRLW